MSGSASINISPQTPVFTGNALSMAFVVGATPIESFDLEVAFDPAVLNAGSLAITPVAGSWNILLNVVGSSIFISGFASNLTTLGSGSTVFRLTGNLQTGASRDLYLDISGTYNDPAVTIPVTEFSFLNSAPTGQVVVSGTPTQGQTLTANASALADADGLGAFSYQWQADGTDIANATGTSLVLTQSEVGRAVRVVVRYVDGRGVSESVTSSASASVANVNDPLTGALTIDGALVQGQTLTANTSALADIDGLGAFSFQWRANGMAISGATAESFTLTQDQVGALISVAVSYTDGFGAAELVTSDETTAVANVNDAPAGSVVIRGIAAVGQPLTASHSLTDADGIPDAGSAAVRYRWRSNGELIPGVPGLGSGSVINDQYTLTSGDLGKIITVDAVYTDAQGTAERVTSEKTRAVAGILLQTPGGSVPSTSASLTLLEGVLVEQRLKLADLILASESLSGHTLRLINSSPSDGVDPNSLFELEAGALYLRAGSVLDFETAPNFELQIGVTFEEFEPAASPTPVRFTLLVGNVVEPTPVAEPMVVQPTAPAIPGATASAEALQAYRAQYETWAELVEMEAPALNVAGAVAGDGNGDGIPDREQAAVNSLPFLNAADLGRLMPGSAAPQTYVSLVADSAEGKTSRTSTAVLSNVRQEPVPEGVPESFSMPLGLIRFDATVDQVGTTQSFSLYVSASLGITGYWKKNAMDTWVNLASEPYDGSMAVEGGRLRLDFQIQDGGKFDGDARANGVIADPGALGAIPLSLAGAIPVLPGGTLWL